MAVVEIEVTEEMTLSVTSNKIKVYKGTNDPEETDVNKDDILKLKGVILVQNTGNTPFKLNKVEPAHGLQGMKCSVGDLIQYPSTRDEYMMIPDTFSVQMLVDKEV